MMILKMRSCASVRILPSLMLASSSDRYARLAPRGSPPCDAFGHPMTNGIVHVGLYMSTVIVYAGHAIPGDGHDFRDQGKDGGGRGAPDEPARRQWHQHARCGAPYRNAAGLDQSSFSARQAATERRRHRLAREAGNGSAGG